MKKIFLLTLLMLLGTAAVFAAPDNTGKWIYGMDFMGVLPRNGDLDEVAYLGGTVAYQYSEWLGFGVSTGWLDHKVKVNYNGQSISGTKLAAVPVLGEIIAKYPTGDSPWQPYGVLGLGIVALGTHGTGEINSLGLEAAECTRFASKIGIGVDYYASSNWIYFLQAHCILTDASIDIKQADGDHQVDQKHLDAWYLGGGMKYVS